MNKMRERVVIEFTCSSRLTASLKFIISLLQTDITDIIDKIIKQKFSLIYLVSTLMSN